MDSPGTVTRLLGKARAGDAAAQDLLFEQVDSELRRVAQRMLRAKGLRPGVLRGTELVNMACARLLGRDELEAEDRAHFFFLMGRAMRHTLVDEARRATAQKRNGGRINQPLFEIPDTGRARTIGVLDLNEGLDALRETDPECAHAIELHYLCGRSLRETSQMMDVSLHAIRQQIEYGSAWLKARIGDAGDSTN